MTTSRIRGVEVVHWNPRRHLGSGRLGRSLPRVVRVNNFGDVLGPSIVRRLARSMPGRGQGRMLSVGSILQFAKDGDVVWGTGRNGKIQDAQHTFTHLDVRAVRGPHTRRWLLERGVDAPAVYGDPALLLPTIFPEFADTIVPLQRGVTIVPNMHDAPRWRDVDGFLDPTGRLWSCIRAIAESTHVVASSLHGMIVAETFGVPASLMLPGAEDLLKYRDYFEGTGRDLPHASTTLDEALEHPAPPLTAWDPQPLLDAFPRDLWSSDRTPVHEASGDSNTQ